MTHLHYDEFTCRLQNHDLSTLLPGQWINDNIISFAYEFMNKNVIYDNPNVLLIEPSAVHLSYFARDAVFEPLDVSKKEWIFCPINDTSSVHGGGTHWALLVFSPSHKEAYYIDSSSGNTYSQAVQMCKGLCEFCNVEIKVKSIPCIQQTNSTDCGLYCIVYSEVIVQELLDGSHRWKTSSLMQDRIFTLVNNKRAELHAKISEFIQYRCMIEKRT